MRYLLSFAIVLAAASAAHASPMTVPIDQARRLEFSGSAASVVPGNPDIADVKVVDSHTVMVLGKKPGVTNIVVFDAAGHTLFDDEVRVSAPSGAVVTIYRGGVGSDYNCSPYCGATQPGGLAGALATMFDQAAKAAPSAAAAASAPAGPPPTSTPSSSPPTAPH